MTGSGFDVVVTCLPLGKVVPAHPASSPRSELSSFGPQSSWLGPSNQLKVAQNCLELLESSCHETILRSLKVLQSTPDQGKIFHAIESYVLNQYNTILRYILFASGDVTCYNTTIRDDSEEGQPPPSPLQQLIATPEGFLAKQRRRLAEGSREGCYDFAILCVF